MAGNRNSGRRPSPNKGTAPKADGALIKPEGLSPDAEWLWDLFEEHWAGKVGAGTIDSAGLQTMCEMWAFYRAAVELASIHKMGPLQKDIRIAINTYQAAWEHWASRFGMTPADRARLLMAIGSGEGNPLAEFGIVA